VTLIAQDQQSNTTSTAFAPPALAYRDPAVVAFLAKRGRTDSDSPTHRSAQPVTPPPGEGNALPDYTPRADTPPTPQETGLVLRLPERVASGDPLIVHGSFRLPVADGEETVAIGLLLTGDRLPGPYTLQLWVPAKESIGQFAVDLAEAMALPPQRYFAYAFSGTERFGPATFELAES
jgi:hypothetical protein